MKKKTKHGSYVKIYYGYYEINRRGVIRRAKPGMGTYVGRKLKPYDPGEVGTFYVKLHRKGIAKQYKVEDLLTRAFRGK